MTANQAIEIINNAQNYSEHEYNFAAHQVREWKRHSEGLRNIQEIDEDVFQKADKFDEIKINITALRKHMLNSGNSVNSKRIETDNTLRHIEAIVGD